MAASERGKRDRDEPHYTSSLPAKQERIDDAYIASRTVARLMRAGASSSSLPSSSLLLQPPPPQDGRCSACGQRCDGAACAFCEKPLCQRCAVVCASCAGAFCALCSLAAADSCLDCLDAGRAAAAERRRRADAAPSSRARFEPVLDDDEVRQLSGQPRQLTIDHFWSKQPKR